MNNRFDELAKNMAQSVTRRGALKRFGLGLAGAVLGSLGLANKAEAGSGRQRCINQCKRDCAKAYEKSSPNYEWCVLDCSYGCPIGI